MEKDTVWRLTYDDFESILGRDLTQEEKDTIYNKFTIESWTDYVECFLDIYEIK